MCLYLILHDIYLDSYVRSAPHETAKTGDGQNFEPLNPSDIPIHLKHLEYVKSLPRPEELRTALWHNEKELQLLQGSNLGPAVEERRLEWQVEHTGFQPHHFEACAILLDDFTW